MQGSMRVSHLQSFLSFILPTLSMVLFSAWAAHCRCVHPQLQLQQPMLGVRNVNSKAIGRMNAIKIICTNRGQREHSSCWIRRYAWVSHKLLTRKPRQVLCSVNLSADNLIKVCAFTLIFARYDLNASPHVLGLTGICVQYRPKFMDAREVLPEDQPAQAEPAKAPRKRRRHQSDSSSSDSDSSSSSGAGSSSSSDSDSSSSSDGSTSSG
jgi:uncharacterized membrane protein YgcG